MKSKRLERPRSKALKALKELESFTYRQRQLWVKPTSDFSFEREDEFFSLVRSALKDCDESQVRMVKNEIPGLRFYFGSYIRRLNMEGRLISRLSHRIDEILETQKGLAPD
jgi:hypothetical protein